MKKLYFLVLSFFSVCSFAQTIYSENMGTPTGNTTVSAYVTGTAPATFQNGSPIVYTGTSTASMMRVTTPSTGYSGSSGNGNVFFNQTGNIGHYFQIDGINTSAYSTADLKLSFGLLSTSITTTQLIIEQSTNGGTTWTPLTYTAPSANNTWTLISITGGVIPSSATLSLRFSQPSTVAVPVTTQFRLDDIKVENFSASCTLVLGASTTACDAVTSNLDTYTATIPYTGGGSGNYTITPSSGTVGGDNPGTVAAGNITVSGITEGVALTVNLVNGVCNYSATATAPECKPVNALPFIDPFLYTAGTALGSYQTWANANTGDDIVSVADNLSYPGFTSYGNAVSFTGAGKECHTPFTATTATDNNLLVSFLVKVTDLSNVTANETYFAGITDGTIGGYKGRIFIKKNGTQYQLGLAYNSSTTAANYHATLFNTGDVVLVVFGYHFATNTLAAWINPDLATFTITTPPSLVDLPTTPITSIGGFILRQDSDTATPAMVIDELKVASNVTTFLGVNQNTISGLTLYPNPVKNGVLFIETALNSPKTVAIYDLLGKEVLHTTTSSNAVNVHTLSKGLYIAKITEEGKTAAVKIAVE